MRNVIIYGTLLIVTLSLLTLNALALSSSSDNNIELKNNNNEPIGIDICIDFEPYTHEELSNHSDTIVVGTVKEMLPPRWNIIDGKQPNKLLTELFYPDETVTLEELLSTINQTNNNTNDTEVSDNKEIADNQEGPASTIQSKRIPFISFFGMFVAALGAFLILRHR